jgi:uncharacterized membrane protein
MSYLELNFLEIVAYAILGTGGLVGVVTFALYVWQKRKNK